MGLFSFLSKKSIEEDLRAKLYAQYVRPLTEEAQRLIDENKQKSAFYEKAAADLDAKEARLREKEKALRHSESDFATRQSSFSIQVKAAARSELSKMMRSWFSPFVDYPIFSDFPSYDFFQNPRIYSAITEPMQFWGQIDVSARVRGSSGKLYKTTLNSCECESFKFGGAPCKHMYYLALRLGLLSTLGYDEYAEQLEEICAERDKYLAEKKDAQKEKQQAAAASKKYQYLEKSISRLLQETELGSPWLSKQLADLQSAYDGKVVDDLLHKAPPAKKAADKIQRYAKKNRALQKQVKQLEYQIGFYTSAFPWLDELTDVSPDELYREIQSSGDSDDESWNMLTWLSPEEYEKLSDVDKYQLVLDRWRQRPKTKWEIGIGFERFVGYQYELQGYSVVYNGARAGLADLGRDLIVRKGNEVTIVQCKRWAAEKTIHEKHIYQLYGTVAQYQMEHPEFVVSGRFLSTCPLSDVARALSDFIGISYDDQYPIDEIDTYPMVKCNISKSGNKIYHLPVDQQYDAVAIKPSTGECYVSTVAEAEALGFRRAMRHAPK